MRSGFTFKISGCKNGEFVTYSITKEQLAAQLNAMAGKLGEYLSKERQNSAIKISDDGRTAISSSSVTEQSMEDKRIKVNESEELIIFAVNGDEIRVKMLMVEIKRRYYYEDAGNKHITIACTGKK